MPNQRKKKWTVTGESLSTVLELSVVLLWSLQKRDFQMRQKVIKTKEKAPKSHDFSAFLVEERNEKSRHIDFALSLMDLGIDYTQEEYAEHIRAVADLVHRENNFHLTLLPLAPFQGIQILTRKDAVAVLRSQAPYAAFVFRNPALRESVSNYLTILMEQHAEDRRTTIDMLNRLKLGILNSQWPLL